MSSLYNLDKLEIIGPFKRPPATHMHSPLAILSVSELTTFRWTFEEDVRNFAEHGIPAIGVWRQKLSDFGEEKGVELLAESGLSVSSLHWAGGFTGSDGRSHKESVADARDAIQLAAELQTRVLTVYSGSRAGHTHKHARRLLRSAIESLLPLAEEHDVCLAIEPMHSGCAADWTFLTNLEETTQLIDELNSPFFKLIFDTYQLGHDASNWTQLDAIAAHIAIIHLGDARSAPKGEQSRYPLGEGSLPLAEIMTLLRRGGFAGFCEVELMGVEIETCDYQDLLRRSKHTFDALVSQHDGDGQNTL